MIDKNAALRSQLKDKVRDTGNSVHGIIEAFLDSEARFHDPMNPTMAAAWTKNITRFRPEDLLRNGWPIVTELVCIAQEVLQDTVPTSPSQ